MNLQEFMDTKCPRLAEIKEKKSAIPGDLSGFPYDAIVEIEGKSEKCIMASDGKPIPIQDVVWDTDDDYRDKWDSPAAWSARCNYLAHVDFQEGTEILTKLSDAFKKLC